MKNYLFKIMFMATLISLYTSFTTIEIYAITPDIRINGYVINIPMYEQHPIVIDGRTLVPLRIIMEELGFFVNWDYWTQEARLRKPRNTFIFIPIGSESIRVNDSAIELDVPAQLINGRTMVPVRAIAEATGFTVNWDEQDFVVDIFTIENVFVFDPVHTIDPYLEEIGLDLTPDNLLKKISELGMDKPYTETQDWTFYYSLGNIVRDGRRYNIGGDDFLSFFFVSGNTSFHFSSQEIMRFIETQDTEIRTVNGIGVGSTLEEITSVYGNGYIEHPHTAIGLTNQRQIEYFDGKTSLSFILENDVVISLRLSNDSVFDDPRAFW